MNLDVAANVARQSLIATQQQIALSGRNIAAAGDANRSRSTAVTATTVDGGIRVSGFRRAEDAALYTRMIRATSETAKADTILTHLTVLADTIGDPEDETSPAALVGRLQAALADYANAPDDPLFGQTAVERAREVADGLKNAASELNLLRERADLEMADAVTQVNTLLGEFASANSAVRKLTSSNDDATLWMDRRDAIVSQLSQYIGVSVLQRAGGDQALFTDSGITLFDKSARAVEFTRTPVFSVDTLGGTVSVDGMAITGPTAPMPVRSGSIVGHAAVRDTIAPTYRLQIDEIARVLVETFADGTGSLFVTSGPPDYAGTLKVGPGVDPFQGGAVENLRDGSGNSAGVAAYPDRLMALGRALEEVVTFDTAAELSGEATLQNFATGSIGWLENIRSHATTTATKERSILTGASDALSRATGVNMDDEYAQQLAIERNFAATARLLSIIDEMFTSLLEIA